MGIINECLYYQDAEKFDKEFSRKELLNYAKFFFLGADAKQMLKEQGMKITDISSKNKIIEALLMYGLNTYKNQAEFTAKDKIKSLYENEDIETTEKFLEEVLKIDNKIFKDAGIIGKDEKISLDIINNKYSYGISYMNAKEKFINADKDIIQKGEIISCMFQEISILAEDGFIKCTFHHDMIKERDVVKNIILSDDVRRIEKNTYLVENSIKIPCIKREVKGVPLYYKNDMLSGEKEPVYSKDILKKYK